MRPIRKQPSAKPALFGWRVLHRSLAYLLVLVSVATFNSGAARGAEPTAVQEYKLKAVFLYNFTKFVEWPAQAFADNSSPLVLGTYCPASFGPILAKVVQDRTVNGRKLVARPLVSVEQATAAQLIFVCATQDGKFEKIKRAVGTRPVLVVGESEMVAKLGGMIVFVFEGDKVRFEINVASAERSQLKISAQLQKLARVVRRTP